MNYPSVHFEFATIAAVLAGKSIARFGDGEFKLIDGGQQFREPPNPKLASELRAGLLTPHRNCLVAIPTMDPNGPKYESWQRHRTRFGELLNFYSNPEPRTSNLTYYSAFITRPDSAPWINTIEYARQVEQLWKGKRAVVLSEHRNSILKLVRLSAKKLKHVPCPHREAYAKIDDLETALLRGKPEIALLSCGPTATCLANRLAARGLHAVDIGSAGGFLLKILLRKGS